MGDVNQYTLVSKMCGKLEAPFLEIGSKDYGNTQDLRSLLSGKGQYIGIDMEEGDGVDKVLDLTLDFSKIDEILEGERFNTIISLSVLEHCDQPFLMAENMMRLLKPGGRIVVCAPFAWQFHGYPSDYWRFTHEGIKKLFPRICFDNQDGVASTSITNEFSPLDENIAKRVFAASYHQRQGKYLRGVMAKALRVLGKTSALSWLTGYRYVLVPTNVFMTGTLSAESSRKAA